MIIDREYIREAGRFVVERRGCRLHEALGKIVMEKTGVSGAGLYPMGPRWLFYIDHKNCFYASTSGSDVPPVVGALRESIAEGEFL